MPSNTRARKSSEARAKKAKGLAFIKQLDSQIEAAKNRLNSPQEWRDYFTATIDGHTVPGLGNITGFSESNGTIQTDKGVIVSHIKGGDSTGRPRFLDTLPDNLIGAAVLKMENQTVQTGRHGSGYHEGRSYAYFCKITTNAGEIVATVDTVDDAYSLSEGSFIFVPSEAWPWYKDYRADVVETTKRKFNYDLFRLIYAEATAGKKAIADVCNAIFIGSEW